MDLSLGLVHEVDEMASELAKILHGNFACWAGRQDGQPSQGSLSSELIGQSISQYLHQAINSTLWEICMSNWNQLAHGNDAILFDLLIYILLLKFDHHCLLQVVDCRRVVGVKFAFRSSQLQGKLPWDDQGIAHNTRLAVVQSLAQQQWNPLAFCLCRLRELQWVWVLEGILHNIQWIGYQIVIVFSNWWLDEWEDKL